MRTLLSRVLPLAMCLGIVGCAERPLPKYERPIARTQYQRVRTTAYTDTEADHVQYTNHNALGGTLQSGVIHSAAADWSRWPAGTIFRVRETGEIFQVDDYGWALSGTNTIDLYKPSREEMNLWGVRGVTIENLQWGNPKASLAILKQRSHYRHIQRMIQEMESRMAELQRPVPAMGPPPEVLMVAAAPSPAPPGNSVAQPFNVASASSQNPIPRAVPVTGTTSRGSSSLSSTPRDPFYSGAH